MNEVRISALLGTMVRMRDNGYKMPEVLKELNVKSADLRKFCSEWFDMQPAKFIDRLQNGVIPVCVKNRPEVSLWEVSMHTAMNCMRVLYKETGIKASHIRRVALKCDDVMIICYENGNGGGITTMPVDAMPVVPSTKAIPNNLYQKSAANMYNIVMANVTVATFKE